MSANDRQHGGSHYGGGKFQHWDLISKNGIGYLEGVASKYPTRWKSKNGAEDIEKAIHYCDKILDSVVDYNYRPAGHAPNADLRRFFMENGIEDEDERLAITYLCQWNCEDHIYAARVHLDSLLVKARAFEKLVPQG